MAEMAQTGKGNTNPMHFQSLEAFFKNYQRALVSFRPLDKGEITELMLPTHLSPLPQVSPFIGKSARIVAIAKGRNGRSYTPLIVCNVEGTFFPLPARQLLSSSHEIMELIEALPGSQ